MRSYVAKRSHLYKVDKKPIFYLVLTFSEQDFESNAGENSKSNYDTSSSILDDKRIRPYVMFCIVLYHPNKLTFVYFFFLRKRSM